MNPFFIFIEYVIHSVFTFWDSILSVLANAYNSLPKSETLVSLYFLAFVIALIVNDAIPKYTVINKETLYEWYMILFYIGSPFLLSGLFMNFKVSYVYALITWWFFAWIICLLGGKSDYFPLSYALVVFYSEYYELPIYFHRYLTGYQIPVFLIIVKISMVFMVWFLIDNLGFNGKDFVKHIVWFTVPYIVFGWLIVDIFSIELMAGHISPIILKFICLVDLVGYMFFHEFFAFEDIEP